MLASLYIPADSWLHHMDSRVKMLLVTCGLALVFSTGNVWVMITIVITEQAVLLSAGVSGSRVRGVGQVIWVTVALVFVLWVLCYPSEGPALLSWWRLHIS